MKTLYITRSNLAGWTDNQLFNQCPLAVANGSEMTLMIRDGFDVPKMLKDKCRVATYRSLKELLTLPDGIGHVYTSFDFPCMMVAAWLKFRNKVGWTVFLWDPPSLSHRDRFPPLRWAIDVAFRWFARRCDKLVLNIHPGLLDEIGFRRDEIDGWRRSGKLELRMQDAFEGLVPSPIVDLPRYDFDVGILSVETKAKGKDLVAAALKKLPGATCAWVCDLPQEEAFAKLRRCRVLLVPYLPVPSLKWNYPLKLFEYLSLGRPILASDNPGNTAVAERFPGRIRLFKSGDADDLAEKCAAYENL